ncbi:MAG: hypothetical protein ACH37Z_12235 [Anaerolineae bacterium]
MKTALYDRAREGRDETPEAGSGKGKKSPGYLVDFINERIDSSAEAKKQIEKDAQRAYNHLNSHLDEAKHPFPTKVYDPVFFGAQVSGAAKAADAIFTNPPVFEYQPRRTTTWSEAELGTAVSTYYLDEANLRTPILNGYQGTCCVGTQFWYAGWKLEERVCEKLEYVPVEVPYLDPITGQETMLTMDSAKPEWVPYLEPVADHPTISPIHILNAFPDDLADSIEGMEGFGFREFISAREARLRIKSDGWRSGAVNRAIAMEIPTEHRQRIKDSLDWLKEIGLRTNTAEAYLLGEKKDEKRRAVEVIEYFYRRKNEIWRAVLLNRAYIAINKPSPFNDGMYPFLMSRNYSIDGQLWGLSDYRIGRYLIRGIQTLRNAAASEALLASMPPLLLPEGALITGKRYEPRAEWYLTGCSPQDVQFLQAGVTSRQIGHAEADQLQQRLDVALGTSDASRGSVGNAAGAKATTVQLAFQAAGLRDKFRIENFGQDFLVPAGTKWRSRIKQFGSQSVWVALSRSPKAPLEQIWPEDHRDLDLASVPTSSVNVLKAQKEKRVLELAQNLAQNPEVDQRALTELTLETIAPEYKDRILKPLQMLPGGLPGAPGMPPGMPQPGAPSPEMGPRQAMGDTGGAEMQADLTDAYAA